MEPWTPVANQLQNANGKNESNNQDELGSCASRQDLPQRFGKPFAFEPAGLIMKDTSAPAACLLTIFSLAVQIDLLAAGLMLTTVARFDGTNGSSGTTLLQASDGNLYGVSEGGGSYQLGTVFRLTSAGELSAIASFDGTNGAFAHGGLIQGADGNLYGATDYGGSQIAGSVFSSTYGTIYKVTTNGLVTPLHSFNSTDGAYPFSKLTMATDGSFYGTTHQGGAYAKANDVRLGTIFRVTSNGDFTL
jgi:uncharacterized repeat protein (TIGR03803 family)